MNGKHLAIGVLVALFAVVGLVFWLGATGDSSSAPRAAPTAGSDAPGPPQRGR